MNRWATLSPSLRDADATGFATSIGPARMPVCKDFCAPTSDVPVVHRCLSLRARILRPQPLGETVGRQ